MKREADPESWFVFYFESGFLSEFLFKFELPEKMAGGGGAGLRVLPDGCVRGEVGVGDASIGCTHALSMCTLKYI